MPGQGASDGDFRPIKTPKTAFLAVFVCQLVPASPGLNVPAVPGRSHNSDLSVSPSALDANEARLLSHKL